MADLPKVEIQSSAIVLRDLRVAIAMVMKEVDALRIIQERVDGMIRQCAFYERRMDGARAPIVRILTAQLRHAEAERAEEYITRIDEALVELKEKNKKIEEESIDAKGTQ